MPKKYLRVTMPDGSKWDVPAQVIAEDSARYYAEIDTGKSSGKDFEECFNEELKVILKDDYRIIDWASNNMNWSDVAGIAIHVSNMEIDFQEGWVNGEKEVVIK